MHNVNLTYDILFLVIMFFVCLFFGRILRFKDSWTSLWIKDKHPGPLIYDHVRAVSWNPHNLYLFGEKSKYRLRIHERIKTS